MKKKLDWLGRAVRMGLAAILISFASSASAQMATPWPLETADQSSYEELKSLMPQGQEIIGDASDVYARHVGFPDDFDFLVVRVEGKSNCIEDRCITFIISDSGSGKKVISVGWLPKKMSASDYSQELCSGCDKLFGLTFVDEHDKNYGFWVSKDYAVLFDGSLKGY